MPSLTSLVFAGMLASAGTVMAQMNFETDATQHDYPSLADGSAKNNPPWCEMGYDSLDLNSITAYCAIDKSQCGTCLNICGSKGCKYMLVVDQCARGPEGLLDISTGAGMEICGTDTGHSDVTATQVDARNCLHIWNGKMFFDYQAPYGGLATLKSMLDGQPPATVAAAQFAATAVIGAKVGTVTPADESTSTSTTVTEAVSHTTSYVTVTSTTSDDSYAPTEPAVAKAAESTKATATVCSTYTLTVSSTYTVSSETDASVAQPSISAVKLSAFDDKNDSHPHGHAGVHHRKNPHGPNALREVAAAPVAAYAADNKVRDTVALPAQLAKRSAASSSTGTALEAVLALTAVTVAAVIAI